MKMDIALELHKLITRFELCVSKFDPAVHKFKFGISYVQDEIQQILQQLDIKDFCAHTATIKLRLLSGYISTVEKNLNIASNTKDIVIDDKEHKPIKTEDYSSSIVMANDDKLYYNNLTITIDGINWSVPNYANKLKTVVIDDNIPNLTYGLKTDVVIKDINNAATVTIKTFFNGQSINHKDIVPPKISKPNNDTVIE